MQTSALEQLSQAYAKGKPDMMEWRTAMTAMPAQLKQVAIAMGYANASALGEELRNGSVSMNDFMLTIHRLNTEGVNGFASFEEQARGSTGGIQTSITNVKTALTRGIADIINSVGRSNIAGFFQNVSKAISSAIPYVTAFVKACIWAINSVAKLFGGGNIIDTNAASKAVDNVNNSVKNLDKSNKNANKSAKDVTKTLKGLAGFDEMNVLTETKSGSTGGGDTSTSAGGDIGSWDTSGWETATTTTSGKIDELVGKMKEFLKLVGTVGAAFALWKISKTVLDFFINPGNLGFFKMMGDLFGVSDALDALTLGDKFTSLGGAISTVAGVAAFAYGVFDAWINGLDWKNFALLIGGVAAASVGLYFAIKPFSTTLAPMVAGIAAVVGGVALLVVGIKDFITNGPSIQNTILIIGGAIAIAVGLATAGVSVLISAIVGVVAAIGSFVAAILLEEPAIMSVTESQELLTAAKNRAAEAENGYVSAVDAADAALKRLDEAEKAAGVTGAELYAQVQSGTLDYANMTDAQKEVYKAYLDNEQKQKDLKASTEELNAAKKAETLASYENQLALAKESGNYDKFKKSIVDAFEKGELSAEEARDLISKSMSEMSDDSQKAFMEDLPNNIKKGLDPHQYESTGTKMTKWFSGLWEGAKNVFGTVGKFFKDTFSAAWDGIVSVFSVAGEIFVNIKDGIITAFKFVVNGIIKGINTVIGLPFKGLNSVLDTISGISILGVEPFGWLTWRCPVPQIPQLAKGGIVSAPTYAMVGEAGTEAVMPLERNTGWIDKLALSIAEKMGGNNGAVNLTVKLGEDTIFERFIDYAKDRSFETNGEVVFAL
jgi:tape measure domain-containing protein